MPLPLEQPPKERCLALDALRVRRPMVGSETLQPDELCSNVVSRQTCRFDAGRFRRVSIVPNVYIKSDFQIDIGCIFDIK